MLHEFSCDLNEISELCDQALNNDRLNEKFLKIKIWSLKYLTKFEEALETAKFASNVYPKNLYFYYISIKIITKKSQYHQENLDQYFEQIMSIFNDAIRKNFTSWNIRYQKGQFLEVFQKYQEALQCYDLAVEQAQKSYLINLAKVQLLKSINQIEEADNLEKEISNSFTQVEKLQGMEEKLILFKNSEGSVCWKQKLKKKLIIKKFDLLAQSNNYHLAEELYKYAIQNFPNDSEIILSYVHYLSCKFMYKEALYCLDSCEFRNSKEAKILAKSDLLRKMNQYQKELEYLNHIIENYGENEKYHLIKCELLIQYHYFQEAELFLKYCINKFYDCVSCQQKLGDLLQMQSKYQNELQYYEQAIIKFQNSFPLYMRKVQCLNKLNLLPQSISFIKNSLSLFPSNLELYEIIISNLFQLGKAQEALNYSDELVQQNLNNTKAILIKAKILHLCSYNDQAIQIHKTVSLTDPFCFQNSQEFAQLLIDLQNHNEAKLILQKALQLDPYNQKIYKFLSDIKFLFLAEILNFQEDKCERIKCYEEALKVGIFDEKFCLNYRTSILNLVNDLDCYGNNNEALKLCEKLLSQQFLFEIWKWRSWVLCDLKRFQEALDFANQEIEKNPYNIAFYLEKGHILKLLYQANNIEQEKQFDSLINFYDFTIQLFPFQIQLYLRKAEILQMKNKYKKTLRCYNIALDINQNRYEILIEKAHLLHRNGNFTDAIICYDKLINLYPCFGEIYVKKAKCLIKQNNLPNALSCCTQGLNQIPTTIKIFKLICRVLNIIGDLKQVHIIVRTQLVKIDEELNIMKYIQEQI